MSVLNLFHLNKEQATLSKNELADFLRVTPEALKAFEDAYKVYAVDGDKVLDNPFQINAKQAASLNHKTGKTMVPDEELENRIINELLSHTMVYSYDGTKADVIQFINEAERPPVTAAELMAVPNEIRPQFTGTLIQKDMIEDSSAMLLLQYKHFLQETDPKVKQHWYHLFRQGLDILDLDSITYEILGRNQNSMGNWFPELVKAVKTQDFFLLPKTKIMRVPLPLLQQTRMEYALLTPATLRIVDQFCMKVFSLDENGDYFIKRELTHQNSIFGMRMYKEARKYGNWENICFTSSFRRSRWRPHHVSHVFTEYPLQMSGWCVNI